MSSRSTPFGSRHVLDERIRQDGLRAYYVGFDQGVFRLKPLASVIANVIPEFALGHYQGTSVPITEIVPRLRDAAQRIYTTDKYKKRGEFGELILHLLLRDFCGTTPLISKIRFKDADNETVHGFDAVHAVETGTLKSLWLGESKLYQSGRAGIRDLLADLRKHLAADYLRREFSLLTTKLPESNPDIERWRALLHEHRKLEDILQTICIPMVCTYTSPVFSKHADNTATCIQDFLDECLQLFKEFADKRGSTSVEVNLLLLPVQSKDKLVDELHVRLKAMQGV